MRYAIGFLASVAIVALGVLSAEFVRNNSRAVRRIVGPL